ncbi:hypothetical protein F444_22551 [Phytophthora nicotianae P1976]|uniref:Uncharacterized protein n=1 Tax=Phytophthora nicotianae P1976 TaxID=1317066 RepID=A0A080YXG0_PHYNI|nr:hypothetical protein F444_22551 [Phytophthora nicotianae P1976]
MAVDPYLLAPIDIRKYRRSATRLGGRAASCVDFGFLHGVRANGTPPEITIASPASMGTPSEVKVVHQTSSGTPAGSVPATSTDSTVRPALGRAARRGRRASVGEDCHGLQLDGGFTFLVDCIQKVCSLQSQRATSNTQGQEEKTSAFHV